MKLSRFFKEQGKRVVLARRKAQLTKAEAVKQWVVVQGSETAAQTFAHEGYEFSRS